MTTFVDLASVEEQALELVHYYSLIQLAPEVAEQEKEKAKQSPFYVQHKELVDKKAFKQLLDNLVDQQPLIFERAPEKDVEGCLNLLCSVMRQIPNSEAEELVNKLIANITSNPNDKPLLRLRLLSNLYNLLETFSIPRYGPFVALVRFASDSGNAEVVVPQFSRLEDLLKHWGATLEQARTMYMLARVTVLKKQHNLQAHQFLVKYLDTFESANAETLASATEQAQIAAVEAIKLPEIVQADHLLGMAAIQQLRSSNPKLHRLLQLFSEESLDAFHTFHKENPDFVGSVGLVYEECLQKMRLLSLATLAAQQPELPYSLIARTLAIDEEEVEPWIILAISANVLEAKMDQIKRVVIVTRTTQRVFTVTQWEIVHSHLAAWRQNLSTLLDCVQTKKTALGGQ